jgi:hypothetical protein
MLPGEEVIDELREELLDVKDRFQELTIMSHQIDQRLIRGGECGNLLSEMYESFKQQTSYEEKLASITSMESLIDKFPEEQVLIRLYMDTARNLLEKEVESRERRTAKERASELEERLVELYNVVASDDAVDHEKEQAVISMRSLAEQYPELQSVIRLYVDAAQNKLRELHQVKLEGLEAECRKKLGELLEVISSGSTTLAQKEDQYKEMERLLDVYPSETFTIRLYLDAAMNKITIYRQDEMELKVKEIKARCLELFNLSVAETATGNERDHAFKELQRLHDEHPELSFEIRALVNGAESRIMKKEKKGFFSRIFG